MSAQPIKRPALVVRCAWCSPAKDEPNVSHTICAECAAKLLGSVGKAKGGS